CRLAHRHRAPRPRPPALPLHDALPLLGPATVSAVFRSEVVWVGAAGWVLSGERLTLRTSLGAAVAVLGLLVMRPLDIASSSFLRSEEHTSELQSRENLVCRLLLENKNT